MQKSPIPSETIQISGIDFKLIDSQEANTLIGHLTDFNNEKIYDVFEDDWRFPSYEENALFLLAEDDVEVDTFEMDYSTDKHPDIFILGFIFKGNLTVRKTLSAYDIDNSPALIVLGKTTAFNIYLSGNIHYLGGGLQCDSLVGQYNHGELFVKGETYAWLIYSDDMCMHFERFVAIQALINTSRPDISICSAVYNENNEVISVENYMPSTHRLCDIVRDDALEENKFVYADERNQLVDDFYTRFFEEGLSLIDHNKSELYNYTNFRTDFIHIVNTLSELDEVKSDDGIYIDDGSIRHGFCRFVYQDKPYSQISTNIDNGFNIRMRTLLQRDTQEIMLVLEYLDEDDAVKYEWAADENTTGVEFFVARCAAYKAFEALNAHAARYDFNAENILKIIQSDHVPDNDMNGFSFDIDNTSVIIKNRISMRTEKRPATVFMYRTTIFPSSSKLRIIPRLSFIMTRMRTGSSYWTSIHRLLLLIFIKKSGYKL